MKMNRFGNHYNKYFKHMHYVQAESTTSAYVYNRNATRRTHMRRSFSAVLKKFMRAKGFMFKKDTRSGWSWENHNTSPSSVYNIGLTYFSFMIDDIPCLVSYYTYPYTYNVTVYVNYISVDDDEKLLKQNVIQVGISNEVYAAQDKELEDILRKKLPKYHEVLTDEKMFQYSTMIPNADVYWKANNIYHNITQMIMSSYHENIHHPYNKKNKTIIHLLNCILKEL